MKIRDRIAREVKREQRDPLRRPNLKRDRSSKRRGAGAKEKANG